MADAIAASVMVTVNVPPALEERFVDWLLSSDVVAGFTSYVAYGHGASHDHLSVAEQVSGRQRRIEFRIQLAAETLDGFIAVLAAGFRGVDLYFVVTPVLRSGHLGVIVK
jgi:Protein of unknown function (DUF3240)